MVEGAPDDGFGFGETSPRVEVSRVQSVAGFEAVINTVGVQTISPAERGVRARVEEDGPFHSFRYRVGHRPRYGV